MRKLIFILLMLVANILLLHAQQEPTQKIKVTKAKGSVAVELLKMNVLYVGIDNPVNIAVTQTNSFSVAMGKGTISKSGNSCVIKETTPGADTLFIYDTNNKLIDKRFLRVKPIPKPVVCIGQHCGNFTISKNELLAQKGLIATLQNFDFDLYLRITSFQMSVQQSDNQIETLNSASNLFTIEMKKSIEALPVGTKIYFENIQHLGFDDKWLESITVILK